MNVQKLDTHTYKELFADALKEWKQRTKQEEIYPSDVSYTLLEMQAMLVDMLNYYSEQVQESHKKKYELLQQEPLPEPVCSRSPECKDCPYPRHGFLCWGADGTCLRSRMNEINEKKEGNDHDERSFE